MLMLSTTKQVLSTSETSNLLEVSEATVRNWIKHGYLFPLQNPKNHFSHRDVIALKKRIENGDILRLRNRANKKKNDFSFVPDEYINDESFVREIEHIRQIYISKKLDLELSLFA